MRVGMRIRCCGRGLHCFSSCLVLMCSLPYVTTELGKRALVADTALWARIALSLSVV